MATSGLGAILYVLTLNIWGLPDVGFHILSPLREERVEAICDKFKISAMALTGWDVVLLQEVWVQKDRESLKHCGYPYFADVENKKIPIDSGLLMLSRFPIENIYRLTYPTIVSKEPFSDGESIARKSAVLTTVQHPKMGKVWVVNTHLVAQYDGVDVYEKARADQFQMMVQWSLEHTKGEPIILGGDWNFGPRTPLWGLVTKWIPGFSQFIDADKFCTICLPNTMHEKDEGKVDHLFGSSQFETKDGQTAFVEPLTVEDFKISVSDHFGWETRFVMTR